MQSYWEKEPGEERYLPSEQSVQVTVEVDSAKVPVGQSAQVSDWAVL